jgi:hypothetical protein
MSFFEKMGVDILWWIGAVMLPILGIRVEKRQKNFFFFFESLLNEKIGWAG